MINWKILFTYNRRAKEPAMNKHISLFLVLVQLLSFSGCATIVSGKHQDFNIRTSPSGADVLIDGTVSGTTPMIANLVRKRRHEIVIKKAGYPTVTRATTRGFNWWYVGNIIFGGIIGLIVDPITGAMYKIKPEEIHVDLNSLESSAVSEEKKTA